jgi:hypothetical protein
MRIPTLAGMTRGAAGALLAVILLLPASHTGAEIEKVAWPREKDMVFMWWPKVTPPDNWIHVPEVSYQNHINLFVLEGQDFDDSPAVMYARAIYYENGNTEQELETAIKDDLEGFLEHSPDSSVAEAGTVPTGDGTKLRTISFTPKGQGHWELVSYGREPKYVLMFCISATSKEALDQHRGAFLEMVHSYTSRDEP